MDRQFPEYIEGYGPVRPFAGAFASTGTVTRAPVRVCNVRPSASKVLPSIRAAIEACGPLRILVSCAGVGRMEPLVGPDAVPFALLAHTLQVHLIGTLQVVQLFAADLVRRERLEDGERGVVVMVASGAAFDGPMASSAYTASKGGIVSMTLALARELGDHGIRVNTISPGAFDTGMIRGLPPEMLAAVPPMTPYPKRMGRPSEFADGYQAHSVYDGYGTGNVFRNNVVEGQVPGFGIGLYPSLDNVVTCDNSAPGAILGLVGDSSRSIDCAAST